MERLPNGPIFGPNLILREIRQSIPTWYSVMPPIFRHVEVKIPWTQHVPCTVTLCKNLSSFDLQDNRFRHEINRKWTLILQYTFSHNLEKQRKIINSYLSSQNKVVWIMDFNLTIDDVNFDTHESALLTTEYQARVIERQTSKNAANHAKNQAVEGLNELTEDKHDLANNFSKADDAVVEARVTSDGAHVLDEAAADAFVAAREEKKRTGAYWTETLEAVEEREKDRVDVQREIEQLDQDIVAADLDVKTATDEEEETVLALEFAERNVVYAKILEEADRSRAAKLLPAVADVYGFRGAYSYLESNEQDRPGRKIAKEVFFVAKKLISGHTQFHTHQDLFRDGGNQDCLDHQRLLNAAKWLTRRGLATREIVSDKQYKYRASAKLLEATGLRSRRVNGPIEV
jgi:hypothetical protein